MTWESELARIYAAARRGDGGFASEQVRDLTKIALGGGFSLVIAVDSDGGIGSRENDIVRAPEYVLGRFAARVPLMEIIACGATPIAAFDMLTVPMDELGQEIVRGVRDELAEAGLGADFPLSGSTEDNVPTTMTGIATAIVGLVHADDFRPGRSRSGDTVFCMGLPRSAPEDEVTLEDEEIMRPEHVRAALSLGAVQDVLPVGSAGVWHEAREMARSSELEFVQSPKATLDGRKSAGPSTCVIVSVRGDTGDFLAGAVAVPVVEVGRML